MADDYELEDTDSFVDKAKKSHKADKEYWAKIYRAGIDDAKFLSDDPYAQWMKGDYVDRVSTGRPAITIDQLSQFIHQVANDIRMNTPTINVIPSGYESDPETAEAYKGIIKNIEYSSNADNAYDTGVFNAIKQSLGFIRVDHRYIDDTFNQELFIDRVINPFSCWLDKESVAIDGSDAKHATVIEKISVKEFKRLYPGKEVSCFEDDSSKSHKDDDLIAIAEHFCVEETERTIGIDAQGNVSDASPKGKFVKTRKVYDRKIMRYKLSGNAVLEESVFPGQYIPIVPVYGEENWIDGERNLFSLIRKSKDAQMMFNYWKSLETEILMKAPIAPIMAAEGQVEDFKDDWLNPSKAMVLRYKAKDLDDNLIGAPQRLEPPTIPTGIVNASRGVVDDIKATMGIYGSSLGQRSNETSAVAINARKEEGDVATFHFADNLTKSITQVGRVLVSAIPEIYDTARILRIIGEEDQPKRIGVNGELAEDQEETIDLKKGKYDVKVVTGAPFTTLRQESAQALQSLMTAYPDMMPIMGDLYFKYSDFAGAQQMASRFKKVVDPKFLDPEDREELEQEPIDPEKEQMVNLIQQGQQAIQQMQQEMGNLKSQLDNKQMEAQIKAKELEIKAADVEIKRESLALDAYKTKSDVELKNKEIEADLIKTRIEAKSQLTPDMVIMDGDLNGGEPPIAAIMNQFAQTISNGLLTMAEMQAQGNQAVIQAIQNPPPREVIRDENGNIAGVR